MYLTDCNSPRGIIYYTMEDFRKFILLVTIFSFMSVGWGQSDTGNFTKEIVNISDEEVRIVLMVLKLSYGVSVIILRRLLS